MTVSSDAYFYSIGADFWRERGRLGEEALQETARAFGFDQETGVPLPSEQDGRVPTPEQRKRVHRWRQGQLRVYSGDYFPYQMYPGIQQNDFDPTNIETPETHPEPPHGGRMPPRGMGTPAGK